MKLPPASIPSFFPPCLGLFTHGTQLLCFKKAQDACRGHMEMCGLTAPAEVPANLRHQT